MTGITTEIHQASQESRCQCFYFWIQTVMVNLPRAGPSQIPLTGVMLMKESQGDCGKSRCAARCPNAAACPECQDCEAQQTQCADGYDDASQGCSRHSEHGRKYTCYHHLNQCFDQGRVCLRVRSGALGAGFLARLTQEFSLEY